MQKKILYSEVNLPLHSFMSPVSLVLVTWVDLKDLQSLHEMSMLHHTSVLFTCLFSSYVAQTNITSPFDNSPIIIEKVILTSFRVRSAPKSWSKYTAMVPWPGGPRFKSCHRLMIIKFCVNLSGSKWQLPVRNMSIYSGLQSINYSWV